MYLVVITVISHRYPIVHATGRAQHKTLDSVPSNLLALPVSHLHLFEIPPHAPPPPKKPLAKDSHSLSPYVSDENAVFLGLRVHVPVCVIVFRRIIIMISCSIFSISASTSAWILLKLALRRRSNHIQDPTIMMVMGMVKAK